MLVGSHGTADLSVRHFFNSLFESSNVSLALHIPPRHFESEGNGFSVYAVGATNAEEILVCYRLFCQNRCQLLQFVQKQVSGTAELDGKGGVNDIAGSQPSMDVSPGWSHVFSDIGHKGDDIVMYGALYFRNPLEIEASFGFDLSNCFRRD